MSPNFILRSLTASCFALMLTCGAVAQQAKPFEPVYGQQGKDVVWSPRRKVWWIACSIWRR